MREFLSELKPSGTVNEAVFRALDHFDEALYGQLPDKKLQDVVALVFSDFSVMGRHRIRAQSLVPYHKKESTLYERMLDEQVVPSIEDMTFYCRENAELFVLVNKWLFQTYSTTQKVVFPYGNQYGSGIAHHKKNKLICNIFAENNAYTVMVRLSGKQFESVYSQVRRDTQEYIDNKYPCGDGGWIHYRVTNRGHLEDIQKLLTVKCTA